VTTTPAAVTTWHQIAASQDPDEVAALLDELLDDDCVFVSPAVHAPQEGKARTTAYLTAAWSVLGPTLIYAEEWYADSSAVLEFSAEVDGKHVHGIDLLRWGADGRLTSFTVMVRPIRGLEAVVEQMGKTLTGSGS